LKVFADPFAYVKRVDLILFMDTIRAFFGFRIIKKTGHIMKTK